MQRIAREFRELWAAPLDRKLISLHAKALYRFLTWPLVMAYCETLLRVGFRVPFHLRWTYALRSYRRTCP